MAKATFKDLIAQKVQREEKRHAIQDILVPSMNKTLAFKRVDDKKFLEVLDRIQDESALSEMVEVYKELIYLSCPMLQDQELHKELDVTDPFDTVTVLFELSDITEVGEKLSEMYQMNTMPDKVKNS